MKESEFLRHILQAFEYDSNIKMFRRNVGAHKTDEGRFIRFGEVGQSDIWGIIKECRCPFCNRQQWGIHFEIEVKSDSGQATKAQLEWLNMVAQNNGVAVLVKPERNDPIGLRERITKLLLDTKCPKCYENSRFTKGGTQ
jgi:predicted Zn-ribbon and HTH transcriptional regulator